MSETQAKPLVFIATPCFGGLVSQHYMQSVLGLVQLGAKANFDVTLALLGHDSLNPQPQHAGQPIPKNAASDASPVHRCRHLL
jgi:hypothetical protein